MNGRPRDMNIHGALRTVSWLLWRVRERERERERDGQRQREERRGG
jgi:hypothetical protein